MNIKGLIVSSGEQYRTFECDISVPALKIHTNSEQEIRDTMKKADYTHVIFSVNGEALEVSVYKRDDGSLYANAKEVSALNLERMPILKENTLVKKHLSPLAQTVVDNTSTASAKKPKKKKF
jgi:hypothetical protein